MPRREFEIFHESGMRAWCGKVIYDPVKSQTTWTFYTDRPWPFHKAEFKQDGYDVEKAYLAFLKFLPDRDEI